MADVLILGAMHLRLLSDLDEKIQEQAFCVVRNLAENESDIEMVFRELGDSVLLNSLVSGLESTNEDVVLQVCTHRWTP